VTEDRPNPPRNFTHYWKKLTVRGLI
jgi:hypothetical protein